MYILLGGEEKTQENSKVINKKMCMFEKGVYYG